MCLLMISISSLSSQQFFVKNVGQWESDVMYVGSGEGYKIVVARSGIYINHQQVSKVEEKQDEFGNKRNEVLFSSDNIRLNFVNSKIEDNINENIISGKLSDVTAEFWNVGTNSDWYWDVPCYEEIIISDIYPEISMKFYYEGNNIRYDFELSEKANSNDIKMLVQGSEGVEINNNELIIKTKLGEIRNGNIKSFINSTGEALPTSLNISSDGEVQFDLVNNNKDRITIDPLLYSSYLYNPTAILPDAGCFNIQQRGDEYWLRVWDYGKLSFYNDTIYYPNAYHDIINSIIVYDKDLKKIKKYILTNNIPSNRILFSDEKHLIIPLHIHPEQYTELNIINYEVRGNLCLMKINYSEKKIENGIRIPADEIVNIYFSGDSRILLSYNKWGESNKIAYFTDNAYFSGCDSSFKKHCFYPYFVAVSNDLKEIEYATLIPYSVPSSPFYGVRISDIHTDSKGNIYFVNRLPYDFVNKYDNIVGEWKNIPPVFGIDGTFLDRPHYVSIHKFDKNYNMVKSAAVGFASMRHIMIDSNDELIIIGDVYYHTLDEVRIHEDCLQSDFETWKKGVGLGRLEARVGIIRLNSELKYLRSCIIPGNYFSNLFDQTTAYDYANLGSDVALDEDNSIYFTMLLREEYSNDFLKVGGEVFKKSTKIGPVNDASFVKINSDLTKVLYSTVYGGSGNDIPGFIFVNDTIVTIIGTTSSKDLIVTPDADVSYPHNLTEQLFVVKLSTNTPSSVALDAPVQPYIYPNPTSTYIELPEPLVLRYSEYILSDLLGRTLAMNRLQSYRIDISSLPVGTYRLTLKNSQDIETYLFMKME